MKELTLNTKEQAIQQIMNLVLWGHSVTSLAVSIDELP